MDNNICQYRDDKFTITNTKVRIFDKNNIAVYTGLENFADGIKKMLQLYKQPDLKNILKTSIYILLTAEKYMYINCRNY